MTPPVTPEAGQAPEAERVAPAVFACETFGPPDRAGLYAYAMSESAGSESGGADTGSETPAFGSAGSGDKFSLDGPPPPNTRAVRLETLRKRADFLRAARAGRVRSEAFTLQARKRSADETPDGSAQDAPLIRVGYTCSKKVGNAVARNRAKRRLREAARKILPQLGLAGWDYVLIGRKDETAARPFDVLLADLEAAVARVHKAKPNPNPRHKRSRR